MESQPVLPKSRRTPECGGFSEQVMICRKMSPTITRFLISSAKAQVPVTFVSADTDRSLII